MQWLSFVKVLEGRLKQNAMSLDQSDHSVHNSHKVILLIVVEVGCWLGGVDHTFGVGALVSENSVDIFAEAIVVYKVGDSSFVFVNDRVDLCHVELDLQSAEAGAELKDKKYTSVTNKL